MPFTQVPIAFQFDQVLGQIIWKGIVIAPSSGAGGGPTLLSSFSWVVPAGSVVGTVVHATTPNTTVFADHTTLAGTRAVGMVHTLTTPTTAILAYAGEVPGVGGLLSGAYFVGVGGAITQVPPVADGIRGLQNIGESVNGAMFSFRPGDVFRL